MYFTENAYAGFVALRICFRDIFEVAVGRLPLYRYCAYDIPTVVGIKLIFDCPLFGDLRPTTAT